MLKQTLGVAAFAAFMVAGALQAHAQSVRFFTLRGADCYEVIEGSRTAGGFVNQNRGNLCGIHISGYTDRVQRGEYILTYISGSGVANSAGIKVNGSTILSIPNYPLPSLDLRRVSTNVNADNIVVFVNKGAAHVEQRVPIGKR